MKEKKERKKRKEKVEEQLPLYLLFKFYRSELSSPHRTDIIPSRGKLLTHSLKEQKPHLNEVSLRHLLNGREEIWELRWPIMFRHIHQHLHSLVEHKGLEVP